MGAKKRGAGKTRSGSTRHVAGGLACPDCGFVAKHAMGLGRHRSVRHGALPKRLEQQRVKATPPRGPWITREDAAARAGVHYNTIRHWERRGLIRTTRKAGIRGVFVHGGDVDRAASGEAGTGPRSTSIEELERRYAELVANLERLLAAAKRSAGRVTSGRDERPTPSTDGRARATGTARRGRAGRSQSRR